MIDEVTLGKDGFYHDEKGRPYVRVSTVLKEFGFIDGQYFDDDSRTRGTAVHKAIEFRFKGTLNRQSLDPQLIGWVDAVDLFMAEKKFEPKLLETNVSHRHYFFAGRLDVFGYLDGAPALIDIKSGAAGKAAKLQTGAYALCIQASMNGHRKIPRYALELKENGKYVIQPFPDNNEEEIFAGLASAYWYKHNLGMIKKSLRS